MRSRLAVVVLVCAAAFIARPAEACSCSSRNQPCEAPLSNQRVQPTAADAVMSRATIVARASEPPRRNVRILYYDDAFLFAARDYGDPRDRGGNTEPGLFVHSKENARWIQIISISTAGGRFGTSTTDDPEAGKELSLASVAWDFTGFAQRPYIEQPLRTSGSIVLPDRIDYQSGTGQYELRYLSSWGVPTAETVLYIRRTDLVRALTNP